VSTSALMKLVSAFNSRVCNSRNNLAAFPSAEAAFAIFAVGLDAAGFKPGFLIVDNFTHDFHETINAKQHAASNSGDELKIFLISTASLVRLEMKCATRSWESCSNSGSALA